MKMRDVNAFLVLSSMKPAKKYINKIMEIYPLEILLRLMRKVFPTLIFYVQAFLANLLVSVGRKWDSMIPVERFSLMYVVSLKKSILKLLF